MSRDQLAERADLVGRARSTRREELDRLADVAQRVVDRVRQRVDLGRLRLAGHDQALAAVGLRGRAPAPRSSRRAPASRSARAAGAGSLDLDARGDRPRERGDVARRHGQPVVGHGAGERRRALDDVQPVHRRPRAVGAGLAARGERAGVAQPAGAPGQEVGVERQDDVGLVEVIDRLERPRRTPGGAPPERRRASTGS